MNASILRKERVCLESQCLCTASISKEFKMSTTSKAFRVLLEFKEAIRRGKSISGLNLFVCVYLGNTVQSLFQQARDQGHKAS